MHRTWQITLNPYYTVLPMSGTAKEWKQFKQMQIQAILFSNLVMIIHLKQSPNRLYRQLPPLSNSSHYLYDTRDNVEVC